MSLCAWFPLTGTLDNQGIDNVSFTTTGTSWTTDGKLGKCLKLGYSSDFTIPSLVKSKQISIAYWLRVNTATSTQWLDPIHYYTNPEGGTGAGWVTRQELYSNCTLTGFWFDNGSVVSIPITVGQWAHFAITVDYEAGIAKVYKDGVLQGTSTSVTKTTQITGNNFKIGENGLDLSENDVRIYNHILSPKEIEILARGLVLHYPMTGGGRGCDNLLKYTAVNTTNQNLLGNSINSAWKNLPLTTIDGFACYNYPKSYSSTGFYSGQWLTGMLANTTYTYSVWLYFTSDIAFNFTSLGHFQVYNGNSSASDKSHEDVVSARIYEPSSIKANTWTKVRITFTTNNLAGSYFAVYPRYNVAANVGELYFRDCKLELSGHSTPWIPNSIDNEYSSMGYNGNTEYDVSGYNYHSTYTSLPTYDSSSARYETSAYFGTTGNPKTSLINTSWLPTLTNGTISWWFKYTTGNSLPFTSDSNTHYIAAGASGTNLYDSNIGSSGITMYKDGVVVNTRYETSSGADIVRHDNVRYNANEWHHFCLTGINLSTWTDFKINAYGSWHLRGYLSDVRIYATVLSATQVAELYNTSASISNNGTLMAYELVEQ